MMNNLPTYIFVCRYLPKSNIQTYAYKKGNGDLIRYYAKKKHYIRQWIHKSSSVEKPKFYRRKKKLHQLCFHKFYVQR